MEREHSSVGTGMASIYFAFVASIGNIVAFVTWSIVLGPKTKFKFVEPFLLGLLIWGFFMLIAIGTGLAAIFEQSNRGRKWLVVRRVLFAAFLGISTITCLIIYCAATF